MPYADRYGITITKVSDGVYDVSRGDRSGRVSIRHIYQTEALNEAQALFQAFHRLDRELTPDQQARFDYAVARFKVAAYEELGRQTNAAGRAALRPKYDAWVAREAELRAAGDA